MTIWWTWFILVLSKKEASKQTSFRDDFNLSACAINSSTFFCWPIHHYTNEWGFYLVPLMPKGRKETADKTWIKRSFQHILIGKDGNRGENKGKGIFFRDFCWHFLVRSEKKEERIPSVSWLWTFVIFNCDLLPFGFKLRGLKLVHTFLLTSVL